MSLHPLRIRYVAGLAVCACALLSAASVSAQAVVFNNGIVNPPVNGVSNAIEIRDGAGNAPTTVNVVAGASIGSVGGSSISVFDTSLLNLSGGVLTDELFLFNSGSAQITGGQIVDDITTNNNSSVTVTFVTVDDDLEARDNSVMNINGGSYNEDVESFNTATVNITGGTFQTGSDGAFIEAAGNSVINISGGTFGVGETDGVGGINAIENGVVNISGGDVSGPPEGLKASDNGVINIFGLGAQPASLNTAGAGVINVRDGSLQNLTTAGAANLFGGDGSLNNIAAQGTAVITIFGSNFSAFNGAIPLPFGPITFVAGNLTGILADGQAISNVNFSRNFTGGAQIVLAAIPEPTAAALALLGLTGLATTRRRPR